MGLRLLEENELLVLYIPASKRALVFRVISVYNKGAETIDYGPLPISSGTVLPTLTGGTVTVPEDGVLPAFAVAAGVRFPLIQPPSTVVDEDMWYLDKDYRERLFHVIQEVTPRWLRVDVQIPMGVEQRKFKRDKFIVGVASPYGFGFSRGMLETFHLPGIHYGFRYANDTNINVYTFVRFRYGEYIVEIPKDPELIYNILMKRVKAYWYTMPITTYDTGVKNALVDVYGFEGFPIIHERSKAIEEYRKLLEKALV